MENSAIEAWDLWKTYDGPNYVLQGVNLRVAPGEATVIWGPNGSGKTTLLRILGCLDRPTRGKVLLNGRDATTLGEAQRARVRRELIGFVFQEQNLIEDLTVRENIALPLRISRQKNSAARLSELLGELGLGGLASKKPPELSHGQAQRVAIARALANRPRIVLADEPTASLDPETSEMVLELLAKLAEDGIARVIASHDPLVRRHMTTRVRLDNGRVLRVRESVEGDIPLLP